jgi:hypothetical protein
LFADTPQPREALLKYATKEEQEERAKYRAQQEQNE